MHGLPSWAIGPFRKAQDNPVITPGGPGFDSWAAYNPAVIYAFGKYHMFYRAEDRAEWNTPYCGTSRIGYATSADGVHFEKQGLLLDADEPYEQPAGLEDPRIVIVDGVYHLLYTAYCYPDVFLCSAVSTDLTHWKKLGPIFKPETEKGLNSKSACVVVNPQLEAVKINGRYIMYTNEFYAESTDFINWNCEKFDASQFSGSIAEVCTAVTDYNEPGRDNIVLFVAGNLNRLCPELDLFYAVSECLMSRSAPKVRLDALTQPVLRATEPFEKSLDRLEGQAVKGTIFLDSVFKHDNRWHMYYGASDSRVGAAFSE